MSIVSAPVISAITSSAVCGPLHQVVVHRGAGHVRRRVEVADREDGAPVLYGPLDEAALRRQVHHVVLVDPRRAAQQRRRVHLLGLRLVLQQLHEVVAVDDLGRRRGQVAAHGEPAGVDLARLALVVQHVVDERARPLDEARVPPVSKARLSAAGLVGRKLVGASASSMRSMAITALRAASASSAAEPDDVAGEAGRGEVGQPYRVVDRVGRPRRIGEPAIPGVHRERRLRVATEPPRGRGDRPGSAPGRWPAAAPPARAPPGWTSVARRAFVRASPKPAASMSSKRSDSGPRTDAARSAMSRTNSGSATMGSILSARWAGSVLVPLVGSGRTRSDPAKGPWAPWTCGRSLQTVPSLDRAWGVAGSRTASCGWTSRPGTTPRRTSWRRQVRPAPPRRRRLRGTQPGTEGARLRRPRLRRPARARSAASAATCTTSRSTSSSAPTS